MGDKSRGLYPDGKFVVLRKDGTDAPGGRHDGCEYFVLDITHDPHATPALRTYAASARKDGYELLADDLEAMVGPSPSPSVREAAEESGWLLEKMHNGNVHYISADYVLQWTDDPNKALRLARREDAEALCTIVEDCEKIAPHEWVPAATSTPVDPPCPFEPRSENYWEPPAVTEAGEQERCSDVRILPHWSQPPHECSAFNRLLEPLAHALASITSETRPGVVVSKSLSEKIWTELWQAERELLALQSTAPPSTSEAIRGAAREWMNTWHGAFATNKEREDALVAILSRWFGKGEEVEGVYADYERDPATGEVFTVTKGHYAAPASPSPADEDVRNNCSMCVLVRAGINKRCGLHG